MAKTRRKQRKSHLSPVVSIPPISHAANVPLVKQRIGEIYIESVDHFKFVCIHCAEEFSLLIQFTVHIQTHLQDLYTDSIKLEEPEPERSLSTASDVEKFEIVDVQPDFIDNSDGGGGADWADDNWQSEAEMEENEPEKHHQSLNATDSAKSTDNFDAAKELPREEIQPLTLNDSDSDTLAIQPDAIEQTFECYRCRIPLESQRDCMQHLRLHWDLNKCPECPKSYRWSYALVMHLRKIHFIEPPIEKRKKISEACHICQEPQTFTDIALYSKHMAEHKEAGNYVHKPWIKIKCTICAVEIAKDHMRRHMRIHTGERKHQCSICGKQFSESGYLSKHMVVHTNERKYKCDLCSNAYTTSKSLLRHKRWHTGDFIHKCKWCPKGFGDKKSLKKHTVKMHGRQFDADVDSAPTSEVIPPKERNFKCTFCAKAYGKYKNLLRHKRDFGHCNDLFFSCELCEKRFITLPALKCHIKMGHSSEK